ncbi:MAG TPA: hypothetical protein VMH49_05220 [Thermoplasmata archaeon]|nr:hypothetical protein [Thermoplasmata archaeon]
MQVDAGLASPFPRSEELVRATRDRDRGRTSAAEVERRYRLAEEDVVAEERRLGFGSVTAGFLRTDDLFRPYALGWEGFAVGPLTRWLESNTFYRRPVLLHPPARRAGAIRAGLPPPLRADPAGARLLLPGPYTFAELLDNRSGETGPALVHRLGRLLADELRELGGDGFRTFVLSDPLVAIAPPEGPAAASLEEAYRSIGGAVPGATTIVWTYGADPVPALPLLDRLAVTAVGIDLTEVEAERLPQRDRPAGLAAGVVDPRTTLLEEPTEIVRVVRAAARRRRADRLWLSTGAPLDLLPAEAAGRKLGVLAEAARALGGGPGQ